MSDEQIRAAFERLMDGVEPPVDAAARVAARARRRRRNRAVIGGGMAVALLAGFGGIAWAQRDDSGSSGDSVIAADPTKTPAPDVRVAPTEVTCADGATPRSVSYDHAGYRRFTQLVARMGGAEGATYIDRAASTMWLLRADGTAYAMVPWMGDSSARWFPDGIVDCAGEKPEPGPVVREQVTFEIGHCWLEPVTVDGKRWDVIEEDQGGWGGMLPDGFVGEGEAWRAGDVTLYRDDNGALLSLVPEGDPWTVQHTMCR